MDAIRALKKVGFKVVGGKKHTLLPDGSRTLSIPRHNPINGFTMASIIKDSGLTIEEFKKLL